MKKLDSQPIGAEPVVSAELASSDARLVQDVRDGHTASFGELVRRYERKAMRIAYRFVRNWAMAEDVVQEAFLKAYDNLESFDVSKRLGPWLFRIVVNQSLDALRRTRHHREKVVASLSEDPVGSSDDPATRLEQQELCRQVNRIIDQIPTKYRTVLILRDLEGFSCSEIAAIVKRRETTVRWRLSRARQRFRRLWSRHTASEESP